MTNEELIQSMKLQIASEQARVDALERRIMKEPCEGASDGIHVYDEKPNEFDTKYCKGCGFRKFE